MAISTFTELKTAVDNWLARTDLAGRAPEFIALAEARMSCPMMCVAFVTFD